MAVGGQKRREEEGKKKLFSVSINVGGASIKAKAPFPFGGSERTSNHELLVPMIVKKEERSKSPTHAHALQRTRCMWLLSCRDSSFMHVLTHRESLLKLSFFLPLLILLFALSHANVISIDSSRVY